MSIKGLLTAAAAGAVLLGAGAAFADPTTPDNKAIPPSETSTLAVPADSLTATDAATPPSADVTVTTVAQTPTMTLEVVASTPVADTPANRAKYGGPMSNAGRRTAPRGN